MSGLGIICSGTGLDNPGNDPYRKLQFTIFQDQHAMKKGYTGSVRSASRPARSVLLKSLLAIIVAILAQLLVTAPLYAGSWPMERKATYLSIGYRGFSGQQYYGQQGEVLGLQRLEEQTLSFYSEYGYSKYVSGIVQMPAFRKLYAQVAADSPLMSVQSPGDVDLGLRFTLWPGEHDAISITGLFGIPLGETTQADGLWAGDNEYNQMIKLRYGRTLESIATHVHVESGYNFRSGGYADELHFAAEVGVRPFDPVEIKLHLLSVSSQGNGDPSFIGGSFGFASNNQRFIMYGPEVAVWLTSGMGLNFGLYKITEARNMPSSTVFTSGVFFLLSPRSAQ